MKILITGTPGTGKTEVAALVAKRKGWPLLSLKEIAEKKDCIIGEESGEKIVDIGKLEKEARRELRGKKDAVVEGHLGCEFSLPVDCLFVLRTHPDELGKRIASRAKAAILIGQTAGKVADAIAAGASGDSKVRVAFAGSLEQAVSLAHQFAVAGDVVLLSPACASYDMFDNFQQRGRAFVELVRELGAGL